MAKLNELIRCEDAIKEICKRTCTPGVLCPDAYCKEVKEWVTDDMVVDAVPVVHAHWKEDPSGYCFWICSACGFVSEASAADMLYRFCPVCGAKMDAGKGD